MGVDEAKKIVDDTLNTELSSKGFLVASYEIGRASCRERV